MKIIIPGGSGQIGRFLATHFHNNGHTVIVLSRNPAATAWRSLPWDGKTVGQWANEIDGADVVINLAGRSVNCRYNTRNRHSIKQSRIDSTRVIGEAIAAATAPPAVWLQMSTATIYAHRYAVPNDEPNGILGNQPTDPDTWRFSYAVATSWEATLQAANVPQTRKVLLRSAMVMEPSRGGVFDTFLKLVRLGLGGRQDDGKQYVSWIHYQDFIRIIEFLIEQETITGAVNLAAPNPLPNAHFMAILRRVYGAKIGLPAPRWMIEIGTRLLRTESELVLKSRRVVSTVLPEHGFSFLFPEWEQAAATLCDRYKVSSQKLGAHTAFGSARRSS